MKLQIFHTNIKSSICFFPDADSSDVKQHQKKHNKMTQKVTAQNKKVISFGTSLPSAVFNTTHIHNNIVS